MPVSYWHLFILISFFICFLLWPWAELRLLTGPSAPTPSWGLLFTVSTAKPKHWPLLLPTPTSESGSWGQGVTPRPLQSLSFPVGLGKVACGFGTNFFPGTQKFPLTTCRSVGVAQPWGASSLGVHPQHHEDKTEHSNAGEEANSPSLGEAFKAAPFFLSLT